MIHINLFSENFEFMFFSLESQCSDLSDPDNGRVLVSGRIIGSIATYDCNEGFELQGGSSTRVCRDNQEWSGTTPTCRGVLS